MSLDIDIFDNLDAMRHVFNSKSHKAAVKAAKRGANRARMAMRTRGAKLIREKKNIKASVLKRKYIFDKPANGSSLTSIKASVTFSGKPMELIDFVVGPKKPAKQKGISPDKRKPLKVRINKGRTKQLKRGFILKTQRGSIGKVSPANKLQVFVRTAKGKAKDALKIFNVKSIGSFIGRRTIRSKVRKAGEVAFRKNFLSAFKFNMDKELNNAGRSRLRKR